LVAVIGFEPILDRF